MLALYHDLLALRPRLGDEMRMEAPSDTTLLVERPPVHVAVTLEGPAQFGLSSSFDVVLHTEQSGYTLDPRPPALGEEMVSFSRPGRWWCVRTDGRRQTADGGLPAFIGGLPAESLRPAVFVHKGSAFAARRSGATVV